VQKSIKGRRELSTVGALYKRATYAFKLATKLVPVMKTPTSTIFGVQTASPQNSATLMLIYSARNNKHAKHFKS